MANENAGKPKRQKVISKLCVKCGEVRPLSEFYGNKEWAAQSYHDVWCKECAAKCCVSIDGAREYCWYNNRLWSNSFWEMALKKAMYALSNDDQYLRANEEKRRAMEDKMAGRYIFSVINLASVYRYAPNVENDGAFRKFNPAAAGSISTEEDEESAREDELIYSREWNGMYTRREIDYQDDYYARLEEGFVLDNQNIQDYARKAAKASLDADIKYDKMRHGQASVNEWRDAQAVFDNLSKSANFAACRRKPGDMAGLGSLGAIVAKIEMSGELDTPQVEFPPDDIDRIIADFRHTIAAVGIEQVTV